MNFLLKYKLQVIKLGFMGLSKECVFMVLVIERKILYSIAFFYGKII